MIDTFSALADPTRRSIIQLLANKGQLSATEISEKFPVTPPAISQHLKVLREAELVVAQKHGQRRLYQINPQAMRELEAWCKKTRECWAQRLDVVDELLKVETRQKRSAHLGGPASMANRPLGGKVKKKQKHAA